MFFLLKNLGKSRIFPADVLTRYVEIAFLQKIMVKFFVFFYFGAVSVSSHCTEVVVP